MKGLKDAPGETSEETKKLMQKVLEEKLKVTTEIVRAHRIGIYKEGRSRPIVMKLEKESDKEKIYKTKRELKGTAIYIEDDYSWKVRKQRFHLREVAKKEREAGRKVTVNFDKLSMDGIQFRWNLEEQRLERVQRQNRKKTK